MLASSVLQKKYTLGIAAESYKPGSHSLKLLTTECSRCFLTKALWWFFFFLGGRCLGFFQVSNISSDFAVTKHVPNFSDVLAPPRAEENCFTLGFSLDLLGNRGSHVRGSSRPSTVVLGISPQSFPSPCGKILVRKW